MAGGKNSSEFIVKLLDQISEPAAKAAAAFNKIGAAAKAQQTTFESQAAFATRLSNGWLAAAATTTAAGYAISETLRSSVEAYSRLDEAMTKVQIQSGRSKEQMDGLRESFEHLSGAMYFGVRDSLEASALLGEKLNSNTDALMKFNSAAEGLALGTGSGLKSTMQTLKTMQAYTGLAINEVGDMLQKTANLTGTNMEDMQGAAGNFTAVFDQTKDKSKRSMAEIIAAAVNMQNTFGGTMTENSAKVMNFNDLMLNPKGRLAYLPGMRQAKTLQEEVNIVSKRYWDQEATGAGKGREWLVRREQISTRKVDDFIREMIAQQDLAATTEKVFNAQGAMDKAAGIAADSLEGKQRKLNVAMEHFQEIVGKPVAKGWYESLAAYLDVLDGKVSILSKKFWLLSAQPTSGSKLSNDQGHDLGQVKHTYLGDLGGGIAAHLPSWALTDSAKNAAGLDHAAGSGRAGLRNRSVPHLARGGIVTGPTLAMIGEGGGPEAVIPLSNISATERAARGQNASLAPHDYKDQRLLQNPLDSIDSKMTKLIDSFKKLMGGGPGGEAAGGGGSYSGGRGRGGGESPQRGHFGHRGGDAGGAGWSGQGVHGWWTPEHVKHAIDVLKKGGLSQIGAEGLVSRWVNVEAAGGPGSKNPTSGAIGIGQWLGARKQGVTGDFDNQLQHALSELHGSESKAFNKLNSAKTDEEAATGASMFERAEGYSAGSGRDNYTSRTAKGMAGIRRSSGGGGTSAVAPDGAAKGQADPHKPGFDAKSVPFHDYHKDMSDARGAQKVAMDNSALHETVALYEKIHRLAKSIPRGKAHIEVASNDRGLHGLNTRFGSSSSHPAVS
jgi:hypothetical protein